MMRFDRIVAERILANQSAADADIDVSPGLERRQRLAARVAQLKRNNILGLRATLMNHDIDPVRLCLARLHCRGAISDVPPLNANRERLIGSNRVVHRNDRRAGEFEAFDATSQGLK